MVAANIVQLISLLGCLSTIGQFLFHEGELKQIDINKEEPTVKAMNKYFIGFDYKPPNKYTIRKLNVLATYIIKNHYCKLENAEKLVKSIGKKSNKYVYFPKEKVIAVVDGDPKLLSKLPDFSPYDIRTFQQQYKVQSATSGVKKDNLKPKKDSQLKPTKPGGPLFKVPAGFRTHMLHEKDTRVQKALDTINDHRMQSQVAEELSKYLFLKGDKKTELVFVNDWKKNNFRNKPEWSEEYKIELPEVFNKLRYEESLSELEVKPMSKKEEKELKDSGYAAKEGYKYMSYEDFTYARIYIRAGFDKVAENTQLGRKMRKAFYQLAIRQSDDSPKEYPRILYRGERHNIKDLSNILSAKTVKIQKFDSYSTELKVAERYGTCDSKTCLQLIYTAHFSDEFLRVKIENLDVNRAERETLLLPGTIFTVQKSVSTINKNGITIVHSEIHYRHKPKLEAVKDVMKELKKLKDLGA